MQVRKELIHTALTIAGSDSGGGAGIAADLKTFAALGVHGLVVITAVTAQNTKEVKAIYDLPADLVVKQIETVAEDIGIDAAKTGMLSNSAIVSAVAKTLSRYDIPLVVDPVFKAKGGAYLLRPEAIDVLKRRLIPIATIVTPNRMEAEILSGIKIRTIDDARRAAKYIVKSLGANAALVKGGHINGEYSIDILYYNGRFKEYSKPRLKNACTHGAGCSFSAAITAELAKGKNLEDAINTAKELIFLAIRHGLRIGKGFCPVNPTAWLEIPAERYIVIEELKKGLDLLMKYGRLFAPFIPEVYTNLVMALPKKYVHNINDVAGILGRIARIGKTIKPVGSIAFGASSHVARAVIKMMDYDPTIRSAMNLRYDVRLVEAAKKLNLKVSYYDRREEPPEIKRKEGATIPWGIEQAVKRIGTVPDVVYHLGDWGKEPMILIFGKDPTDVVRKALRIIRIALGLKEIH